MKSPAFKLNQQVVFNGNPVDYPWINHLKPGDIGVITLILPGDPRCSYFLEFLYGHCGEIRELDLEKI